MKVTVYTINGHYSLKSEEGQVLYYQPRAGWKTIRGAKAWAEKNGYEFYMEETEEKENKTMAKKTEITNVAINNDGTATVTYSTGTIRPYKSAGSLPKTALDWLESHRDPEPATVYDPAEMARPEEYQAIHDSMVESFYEYCTGEKIPDNWKEILQEKKRLKATKPTKPTEAVEIILEDITQDPEYHDTPIPPRNPDPQPPAPTGKPGRGAAESVAFGLCLGLACMVYGAKELAELLILAIQALWISTVPLARKAGKAAYRSWLEFYPVARQTAGRTARIASRQIALAVWYVWIVIA